MLQHLILIHFSLHYLPGSRLREVENKGKCQTVSSKSGRGHLREVVSYKSFQVKSLYLEPLEEVPNKVIWVGTFGKLLAEERWWQLEVQL